jgi:1-acyl-sn-glycerol-3-phosphate acyltransferase
MKARVLNWFLRIIFSVVCRIDKDELSKIPLKGPLILVGNHVNFLEAPVMVPFLDNPSITALAKRDSWDNPLFKFLFNVWGVIPIERDMIDQKAFRQSEEALKEGKILAVFPEGTRSKNGRLLKGKPGVVALAMRSKATLMPIAFYGYENFWDNLKHFRRTDFHIVVGEPFRLETNGDGMSREVREVITDEIMFKIAELLPKYYQGVYEYSGRVAYRYAVGN